MAPVHGVVQHTMNHEPPNCAKPSGSTGDFSLRRHSRAARASEALDAFSWRCEIERLSIWVIALSASGQVEGSLSGKAITIDPTAALQVSANSSELHFDGDDLQLSSKNRQRLLRRGPQPRMSL